MTRSGEKATRFAAKVNEFFALDGQRGSRAGVGSRGGAGPKSQGEKKPARKESRPERGAYAPPGCHGAQVALLRSPILRDSKKTLRPAQKGRNFFFANTPHPSVPKNATR